MQIFKEITKNKGISLALGYFDAMHQGHIKIIKTLSELNTKTAVITFKKNPANYFSDVFIPDIQTTKQKEKLIAGFGIDYIYELDFEKYKNISAKDYINILIENFEPKNIIAGYNHTFGKERSGNSDFLKDFLKNDAKCNVVIVDELKIDNQKLSSSSIRKLIQEGNLKSANNLLNRFFSVKGEVVHGDKIARTLGYKTANINWNNNIVKLPYGVYVGSVEFNNKKYDAMISWGVKPTLKKENKEILEAHLYNFDGNLYGKEIEIFFVEKLREQRDFGNIEALKNQLDKDFLEFKRHIS